MSMKSSLISEEIIPGDDTTITLDDMTNEFSRLNQQTEERTFFNDLKTEKIKTRRGDIHVAIQGEPNHPKRTAIVTLHDIGQNHSTCFQSFFSFHQFKPMLNNFTIYHLNFPGQEEDAAELPQDFVYPTMEEMADGVEDVFHHYGLKNTICFGVGAGANVFTRVGFKDPKHVECLVLINGTVTTPSWSEWGYEKMSAHHLKTKGMTTFCQDYLLWHYFGTIDQDHINHDLVGMVKDQLHRIKHPRNLALFLEQYSKRKPIKIARPQLGHSDENILKCGVLLMTGDHSPALDDTVTFNSKLDPTNSTWIKITDATSMVLEEQPTGVTNAIVLFLQGYGHVMKVKPPSLALYQEEEIVAPKAIC